MIGSTAVPLSPGCRRGPVVARVLTRPSWRAAAALASGGGTGQPVAIGVHAIGHRRIGPRGGGIEAKPFIQAFSAAIPALAKARNFSVTMFVASSITVSGALEANSITAPK